MPAMSSLEAWFCRSAPWRFLARRSLPWATQHLRIAGDVLEIGGGNGVMAETIVQTHQQVRIVTTDADPAMVSAARERLARFRQAAARRADATRLPFDDDSFDVVVSFLMLHHVLDWEAAVAQAARVLRPGGCLIGWDLLASRFASLLHTVDRSPHRLVERHALETVLDEVFHGGFTVRYSFGGKVARFAARKS